MIAISTAWPTDSQGAAKSFRAAPFRRTKWGGSEDLPIRVELVSEGPRTTSHVFHLGDDTVLVGRCVEATVRVDNVQVSRRHCEISRLGGTLAVRDVGSTNGTFVNGFKIDEAHLMPGDELKIGNYRFVVRYEHPAALRIHDGGLRS
jgi:pSer/pThr/pTyr-binding forkhead associated (FHA) protein